MPKANWNQYSATAGSNTDVGGVDTDESSMMPSDVNNAIRELMSHTADVVAGTVALSSINIDGGAIDGVTMATSDITVGSGKTLDVSAGTLTLAADQISGDAINGGTINGVTIAAAAFSGSTTHADNAYAQFGASNDLKVGHNGSHSYISEEGTGQLYIRSNYISFTNAAGSETMSYYDDDGAVSLYFDNSVKLATTAAGVSITGGITSTGTVSTLSINGSAPTATGADVLTLLRSGSAGNYADFNIVAGNTGRSRINFGDTDDMDVGQVSYDHNDNSMAFSTAAAERMRIESSGDIGIGTTAPHANQKIHMYGGASGGAGSTDFGMTIENSGDSQLQFLAPESAGYTSRINFGSVTNARDGMISYTQQAKYMAFNVANAERMRITSTGVSVTGDSSTTGIIKAANGSNSAPSITFTNDTDNGFAYINANNWGLVVGGAWNMYFQGTQNYTNVNMLAIDAAGPGLLNEAATASNPTLVPNRADLDTGIGWATTDEISIITGGSEAIRCRANGDTGLGCTDPATKLDLRGGELKMSDGRNIQWGGANCRIQGTNNGDFELFTGATERFTVTNAGNVGIQNTAPIYPLTVSSATSPVCVLTQTAAGNNTFRPINSHADFTGNVVQPWTVRASNSAFDLIECVTNNGSEVPFRVRGDGAVACTGALSKGSGSFKISHPLPEKSETHNLVHSFIEGPQADLIYRGKAELTDGAAMVNIDSAAGMTEGTFTLLCRDVQCFTSNESGWTAIKGSVAGNILTIAAQDEACTDTVSWMVIGERQDEHMYETDWTDDEGKVIVEPLIVVEPPIANEGADDAK